MSKNRPPRQDPDPEIEPGDDYDPLNIGIIRMLQEDGRMPFSQIAKALDVSEGTVRNRVRQLLDDNVIAIEAHSIPKAFGYTWNSITFLNVAPGADIDAVAERLSAIPEAFYVVMLTGRFDLGVAAFHKSDRDFRMFLTDHCYGRPDIARVEPNFNLEVYKFKSKWRLRD